MTAAPSSRVFDMHAPGYDDVAESALGLVLRARVRSVIEPRLSPDVRVLDLGCGTGLDTAWLAPQVQHVHAVDPAAAMTSETQARCEDMANVTVETVGALDLTLAQPVDLVVSNFGAINCAGPLADVGDKLSTWLRPGGIAVLVTMPPICPIERAIAAATRNRSLWNRRRSGAIAATNDASYAGLAVTYATARDLDKAFGSLKLIYAESLGLTLPPFEQRRLVEQRPRLLAGLGAADQAVASLGGRLGWGDHLITVFQNTGTS